MKATVRVQFWGTRGSLAKPGRSTLRYGGNTSCVQVTSPDGTCLIIDCGTGAHDLGRSLLAQARGPLRGSILISHTHWDHIQGFPFFSPLFVPGGHWDIYGPAGLRRSLQDTLAGQMEHTYFPITLQDLGATIRFHDLVEGCFEIGQFRITTRYLNHPALNLGYRLEVADTCVVYACDHEPHSRVPGPARPVHELDRQHAAFLQGADLLIHDSQFTDREYFDRKGWGHSPMEYVCEIGRLAGVRRIALTHHDPTRTDDDLDQIVEAARARLGAEPSSPDVFAAADGQVVDVTGTGLPRVDVAGADWSAQRPTGAARRDSSVLLGLGDAGLSLLLGEAAQAEGVQTHHATDTNSAIRLARAVRPDLILLEDQPMGVDGLEVCRTLRAEPDPHLQNVPIVVVAGRERWAEGRAAGVTQWLITPFSPQYARTQIQAWLLRSTCRWIRASQPEDEEQRLAALRELSILDTEPEERFDRITRLAASLCDVPMAMVSLVDDGRQWFKSRLGLSAQETSREVSFCAHAVRNRAPLIVSDTLLDDRFADNPLVVGEPRIRFYAGFPVFHARGSCLGTLCLVDTRPRQLPAAAIERLQELAGRVQQELHSGPPRTAGT